MPDRDEDFKEVVRALRRDDPYLEKPDEVRLDVGGTCFLDRARMCGPDCASYTDERAPTAPERCTILVGINSGLELLTELVKLVKQPPTRSAVPGPPIIQPPDPMGGRRRGD